MANAFSFLDQTYERHLLLEDPRTYDYFSTLFNAETATIQMLSVGGANGVNGLVNASWQREAQSPVHAFGWVDRDFGNDNVAQWSNPNTHVFRGRCHEIENYFLDWNALANCDLAIQYKKQEIDYRERALIIAKAHLYATICSDVLYRLQRDFVGDFPESPKCAAVTTRQDVENYIQRQPLFMNRLQTVSQLLSNGEIMRRIDAAETLYSQAIATPSDDWTILFPGKEIFEELMHQVYTGPHVNGGGVRIPDLVRSIAKYQAQNGVPLELQNFMNELKRR